MTSVTYTALATADLHISQSLRRPVRHAAMQYVLDAAEAVRPDLAILAGDIFHGTPSLQDKEDWREYAVRWGAICPLFIPRGNHDPDGVCRELGYQRTGADAFSHRHPILTAESPAIVHLGSTLIVATPHFTKAQATANLPADATIEDGDSIAMTYMRKHLAAAKRAVAKHDGLSIHAAHADVRSAAASNGETRRDAALALTVGDLERVGASATFLGHIHQAQMLGSSGTIGYCGSPFMANFGERNDRKSFVIARFDQAGRLIDWETRPIPGRPLYKVEAQLTEDGWAHVEKHRPLPGEFEWPVVEPDAEVWVLLHYPSDRRAEYLTMRDEAARRYPADARIDGDPIPVVERRCVEFDGADSRPACYRRWRQSEGVYLPPEPSLELKLEQLEADVPDDVLLAARGGADFDLGDLEFCGLNGVTEPIKIPYSEMEGLIVLAGHQGSGKTTSMEASLVALTGEMAYYARPGNRDDLAVATKGAAAYISQAFRLGPHEYRSTIRTTAGGAKEAALTCDGRPLNNPKLIREWEREIRHLVGTHRQLELTAYQRQARSKTGDQGLFQVPEAERRERIVEMTGSGRFRLAADHAGKRRIALDVPIGEARQAVDGFERQLARLDDLAEAAAEREADLAGKTSELDAADAAWREAVRAEAEIAALPEGADAVGRELEKLMAERAVKRERAVKVLEDLHRQEATAGRRAEVVKAAAEAEAIALNLDAARESAAGDEEAIDALQTRQQEASEIGTAIATKERVRSGVLSVAELARQAALAGVLQAARDCEVAVGQARAQADAIERDNAAAVRLAEQKAKAEDRALEAAKARLLDARDQAKVKTPFGEKCIEAACEFTLRAVRARDGIPALEADIEAGAQVSADAFAATDAARAKAEEDRAYNAHRVASLQAQLERAIRERDEAQARPAEEPAEAKALAGEIADLRVRLAELAPVADQIAAAKTRLTSTRETIRSSERRLELTRETAALIPVVEAAEHRAAELRVELDRINGEGLALKAQCEELQRRLDGLAEHAKLCAQAKEATAARAQKRNEIEVEHGAVREALAAVRGQIAQLEALRPQLDEAKATLARLSADQAEWAEIQRGYGPNGCQALAIDEAGPEIADLTNRLLRDCGITRWSFGMTTQVEKADGKGVKNAFEPLIFDQGELRDIVSGGETAIVEVAARLALAIYRGKRSPCRFRVLLLDEALQPVGVEDQPAAVAMLRRVIDPEVGGFRRVILSSHVPAVIERADVVIRFEARRLKSIEYLTAARVEAPARERQEVAA